jgi:pilus assembly protein TadC
VSVVVALLVLAAAAVALVPAEDPRLPRLVAPGTSGRPVASTRWWVRGRRGEEDDGLDVPLLLDLVAAALDAGTPPGRALEAAVRATSAARDDAPTADEEELRRRCGLLRLGAPWDEAWAGAPATLRPLVGPLGLAARAGAPGAALLRDAATELRRRRAREAQRRAAALGVRLVLPLGVCALPAFALVGVVPVVLALAGRVLAP